MKAFLILVSLIIVIESVPIADVVNSDEVIEEPIVKKNITKTYESNIQKIPSRFEVLAKAREEAKKYNSTIVISDVGTIITPASITEEPLVEMTTVEVTTTTTEKVDISHIQKIPTRADISKKKELEEKEWNMDSETTETSKVRPTLISQSDVTTTTETSEVNTTMTEASEVKTTTEVSEVNTSTTEASEVTTTTIEKVDRSHIQKIPTRADISKKKELEEKEWNMDSETTEISKVRPTLISQSDMTTTTETSEVNTTMTETSEVNTTTTEASEVNTTTTKTSDVNTTTTEASEMNTTTAAIETTTTFEETSIDAITTSTTPATNTTTSATTTTNSTTTTTMTSAPVSPPTTIAPASTTSTTPTPFSIPATSIMTTQATPKATSPAISESSDETFATLDESFPMTTASTSVFLEESIPTVIVTKAPAEDKNSKKYRVTHILEYIAQG